MSSLRLLAIIEASSITGPAKNLLEFAQLAREAGVETVIGTFVREPAENLFVRTARELRIQTETIHERGAFDRAVPGALGDLAARLKPDIVQTHAVKSHFLARCAGLPRIAPWIAFHHGYTWPTLRARAYNQLDRWSLRTAARVLTVSVPFRNELLARGVNPGRIDIIHNAIRPGWGTGLGASEADTLRRSLGIPPGRKVILIVGRLSREKDHLTLLEAVHRLSPPLPHLLIVGEGPERGRIEQRIADLGMSDCVTLAGQQPSAEPYYAISDVVVLSSLSEGSPNALLEGMAAGIPVVATAVGGIPEIVTDSESALLVPPGNAAAMADALERLLFADSGLARRLAEKASALISERHSPRDRVHRLLDIYQQVKGESGLRR